ncbi:MAG: molybdenum cofactor guanylyltransferase [Pontiella sp.]
MKQMPNMLMAGAAGRNRGKTEFLCRAIRAQSKLRTVIGIKITSFDDADGEVLADQMKSKTYRSIDGDFLVTREEPGADNKDTHRMYSAGAEKVYWLRTRRSALSDGLNNLFQTLETDGLDPLTACLVVESGGSRNFIEPGLFFIIQERDDELKPSCAEVAHWVDRLVNVSGSGWDILPEDLIFENGQWGYKEDAAAIVLSGGDSRRMGQDKSVMPVHGQPMLSNIVEQLTPNFKTVMVSGAKEKYAFAGCRVVEDLEPDRGPLMGLLSTLKESVHELNFVTACDVPDIHMPVVRNMLREIGNYDAVVPVLQDARKQPLFAVYRKSVAKNIEVLMTEDKQSMHALLDTLNVHYVEVDADWYHNINTQEDLDRYEKKRS